MPTSRRNFLKAGAAAAVTMSALSSVPRVHAAGSDTIRIALIGCGGRGRGACFQALSTKEGPVELVAIADAFEDQAKGFAQILKADEEKAPLCTFTDDTIFSGLDSYKKAIDCLRPGIDLALLVAPPAFRAMHFEYAVKRGVHVFLEKPFGVDTPTIKRSLAAWKMAQEKGLKVITGLNNRKYFRTEETVKKIQDGAIGDILSCYVYRLHGPCRWNPRDEWSPLQNQLRNYNSFTWISGTPCVDWMVHNIDICCWSKGMHPTWVQGTGGRQVREEKDELMDHIVCDYEFPDGVKLVMQVRHISNTWSSFRSVIRGTKGMAVVGEGIGEPKIFKGYNVVNDDVIWKSEMPKNDSYQEEHNRLAKMIREDLPCEDVDFCIKSNFTGIMGRMAMESGQELTWDTAWNSTYELCPNIDGLQFDGDSPYIMPDADGNYQTAKPGITKRF
ncbi:MAG: Gfo/Idh/MocA family oxidoreductase [Planctomycetia bacterium]|nr:Gfo/Idh/MocA family oxidoreductase [Planctomycetia bacterium]